MAVKLLEIRISTFSKKLCGKFRPEHFHSVVDVIDRFIKIINPKNIYLGEKDMQQLKIVEHFVKENYSKTKVVGCKTIREKNGTALSSRNFLLNKQELKDVEKISKTFLNLKNKIKNSRNINSFLQKSKKDLEKFFNIKIEYLENRNTKNLTISNKYQGSKVFLSYYYKNIRLIDNF